MSRYAMRAYQLLVWILLEQTMAAEEILYVRGVQEESVDISCETKLENIQPTAFHLYRKLAKDWQKVLLLFVNEHEEVGAEYKERIRISGWPSSRTVNVTLLDLRAEDTGLYVCEFTNTTDPFLKVPKSTEVILHVQVNDQDCSCDSRSSVIYIIAAAVVLLLFTLLSLSAAHYRKAHTRPMTAVPIYEQMTTQTPEHRSQSHHLALPANDPVYAIPLKEQSLHSPYAVPKKVKSSSAAPKQDSHPEPAAETD
ncbi:uncharacterized protein [Salminus brasiliensis]|uniref:uncharacterized protein n=1 Tax=Salminus brasiliensis TaxID=930266 RepID=UPI003B835E70